MRALTYLYNNTLQFDEKKCIGCGMCTEVCPHGVFSIENKKAKIIHKRYCMECGACQKNCPAGAIYVNAGVGCAAAVITGMLTGSEPVCGCSTENGNNEIKCC
jgi:NAD-dependent dihydropyrimidine dehydrogenase PreA subunit